MCIYLFIYTSVYLLNEKNIYKSEKLCLILILKIKINYCANVKTTNLLETTQRRYKKFNTLFFIFFSLFFISIPYYLSLFLSFSLSTYKYIYLIFSTFYRWHIAKYFVSFRLKDLLIIKICVYIYMCYYLLIN